LPNLAIASVNSVVQKPTCQIRTLMQNNSLLDATTDSLRNASILCTLSKHNLVATELCTVRDLNESHVQITLTLSPQGDLLCSR